MHWHRWEIVGLSEQPSAFQQMDRTGLTNLQGMSPPMLPLLFEIPVIVTYRCGCGAEKVVRV